MGLMQPDRQPTAAKELPEPEQVFFAWLLSRRAGCDLDSAAGAEIEKLQRYRGPHPGPKRLGEIFAEFRTSLRPGPRLQ